MLQKISIQNYALIDNLTIELEEGLNIVTGETGAGKSIILGALSLILGQRAENKYFFNQNKKCIIEGTFIAKNENLKPIFEANDLDFFKENILRREIAIDGKSRSFINDTPVNLTVLKQVSEHLIDIHSQQATQEINDSNFQLLIVDSLANHHPLLTSYRKGYKQLKQNEQSLKNLIAKAEAARSKQDYEQFLLNELIAVAPTANEQEELAQALARLTNAETIKKNLLAATALLTDNPFSVVGALKEASLQLQSIEKYDSSIVTLAERLRSTLIEIKDIAAEVATIDADTALNAEQLLKLQQRLDILFGLQQKHRVANNHELLVIQKQLEDSLNQLFVTDEEIQKLTDEVKKQQKTLLAQAKEISEERLGALKIAEKIVAETLQKVGMPNAKIVLSHQLLNELNKDGIDEINLLFTANAGQLPAPVSKVASGGELSRLMLAIKSLLAKHTALPTLIFDEIDTGISGETALKVGEVIASLAQNMQVISITHLPQIAAKGNAHYFVYKNEEENKTTTGIKKLNNEERVFAIAEMLSGKNPGLSALQNAKDLLG